MKLFHFRTESYGEEFSVMAKSKDEAINFVREYIKNKDHDYYSRDLEYCIEEDRILEFQEGEVLETEIC